MVKKIDEFKVKNPTTLKVYDKCLELNNIIFELVEDKRIKDIGDVKSQIMRSSTSIGANLAEGNGQIYPAKEISFLNNSLGSANEVRYWLKVLKNFKRITEEQYRRADDITTEIMKILIVMIKKLKSNEVS